MNAKPYDVLLERGVERDLKRLAADDFRRVVTEIESLGRSPRPAGCRKLSGSTNDWRIRVGDYRVIYEIDDSSAVLRVMRVRHRRDVYR